ncbi:hypothetical protein, partial [Streptomyces aureus]|uniref:hypothetical protein n=1 Tax=Streptomyces aureus TaxID=193461 RepID=UPI0031DDF46C
MQNAAEAIASMDLEVGEPVGFADRFGQGTEWRGACESAVGAMLVLKCSPPFAGSGRRFLLTL